MMRDSSIREGFIPIESIQWGSTWPALAEDDERKRILEYMDERFGIPAAVFDDYVFLKNKKTWRLLRKSEHLMKAGRLRVETVGMKAFHLIGGYIKPATRVIQVFGRHARRAKVEMGPEELGRIAGGLEIPCDPAQEDGYVIICRQGNPLGLGLVIRGMLRSQIPKSESRFFMIPGTGPA